MLGPLLFLIYINDLVANITCDVKLFADDTVLYTLVDEHKSSADLLNYNLEYVNEWANKWLVKFNPDKTKSMNISLKRTSNVENHALYFNNKTIESVNSQRHLGVELTSDLRWTTHIDSIIEGVSKLCDVMMKLKYQIDRKSLETMYCTFVRPKLEYASIIWDDCNIIDKMRLENVQLAFARIITGAKRGTSHNLLYNETSWTTLAERRKIMKLKFVHRLYYQYAPEYLLQLLPGSVNKHVTYNVRSGDNIRQYPTRTEKFRKSLLPDCIREFNDVSLLHRQDSNSKSFINQLFEPSICSSLYYGQNRKCNIIHAQFRMNCSNLKAHLFDLKVVDDPFCACSNQIESCEHFFFHCNLYFVQRQDLLYNVNRISSNVAVTTSLLLYGSDELSIDENAQIFAFVENYIEKSDRFII